MKRLKEYLNEGLLSRKVSIKTPIRYKPETSEELQRIITDLLRKGITDFNCIDVSNIERMDYMFTSINQYIEIPEIDVSKWDVSNVKNIGGIFWDCDKFNADLSNWDVSNIRDMHTAFNGCKRFNSDLSKWNVSNVTNMFGMFDGCDTLEKNNKIPAWYKG